MESTFAAHFGRRLSEIMDPLINLKESNLTACPANCTFPRGMCINGSCLCEFLFSGSSCQSFSSGYLTTFATLCYLLFSIASIQLVLCMIYDSQEGSQQEDRWKKAFRMTIRKCLLGTVIGATGTRAIYFTVQHFSFPDEWASILHDAYYPSFITAFSVLICFWAEVFYNNLEQSETQDFMRSHQYFIYCTIFNVLVYLLLLGDIVATPLVNEVEQNRKSIVIGAIFIALLLLMLVGFLHYGVRLFFRPDWRPLSEFFKVNLQQQRYSCVGVVSNALLQCLIIALLLLNLASRFGVVDFHSLYTSDTVIHIIELGPPIWFCCSLWNFKRPGSLWILNPSLLFQTAKKYQSDLTAREPLLNSKMSSSSYGSTGGQGSVASSDSGRLPDCWICLDQGDITDLFRPCKCSEVHRECLGKWIAERLTVSSLSQTYQCQVCKTKYQIKRKDLCVTKEMTLRHWFIGVGLVFLFMGVSSVSIIIRDIESTIIKAVVAFSIIVVDAIILKVIGFCLFWVYKHTRSKKIIILGENFHCNEAKTELSSPPSLTLPLNSKETNTTHYKPLTTASQTV